MPARAWRRLRTALLWCVALVIIDAVALSFEPVRAFAVHTLAGSVLSLRGFHLSRADIFIDSHHLDVTHLIVTEQPGVPVLLADAIDVDYTLRGAHLRSADIRVERPYLVLRREQDGTFNLQRLTSGAESAAKTTAGKNSASTALPDGTHISVKLDQGQIDVVNPYAPASLGRSFTVDGLNVSLHLNGGAVSAGFFKGRVVAASRAAPFHGTFLEDDRSRFAALHVRASSVPIAPVLDSIVSSPAFIAEDGTADAALDGYALQWNASGPQWHVLGRGRFDHGKLYVAPFAAAAREVHGPLTFNDGILFLPRVSARAAGLPVQARGTINLLAGPTMSIAIATSGPLAEARHLFSFSQTMPLQGRLAVSAQVNGSPADPLIAARVLFPGGVRYGKLPVSQAIVALAYFHNHLTFPMIAARYDGIALYGNGDIFVPSSSGAPRGQFVLSLRGPSRNIPWLASVEERGTLSARVALNGPLPQLDGAGFLHLEGPSERVRSSFSSTQSAFEVGPLLADQRRGGSLQLEATLDRGTRNAHGDVVADRFILALNPRRVALPGVIERPYGLPQMAAIVNGDARVDGAMPTPQFDLGMRVDRLSFAGDQIGDLTIAGFGRGGLAWVRAVGSGAQVAGVPFQDADVLAGVSSQRLRIYGASAHVAGGQLALVGDLPIGQDDARRERRLFATAHNIQLADLRAIRLPLHVGEINAFGGVRGTAVQPAISVSADVDRGEYLGVPLSGDAQLEYGASRLALGPSRLILGRSAVTASGSIDGISDPQDFRRGRLNIDAATTEADLADVTGATSPIQGSINARVHVGGAVNAPEIQGSLASAAGTVRGVPYQDLGGTVGFRSGAVSLQDGRVVIGNSAIAASGSLSPGAAQIDVSSPHLDLADFNDFFEGKDVFEGTGSMRLALDSSSGTPSASGVAQLAGVRVLDVPLDDLDADVATRAGAIIADIDQSGALAHTRAVAVMIPGSGASALARLADARYQIHASSSDIDVGRLAPLLPPVGQGMRGRLSIVASASGPLQRMNSRARFALDRGFIGKDPIAALSGDVGYDSGTLRVNAFHLNVSDVDVIASGIYHRNGLIAARSVLRTPSIATVARLAHLSTPLTGSAALAITASGTTRNPQVEAVLAADWGSAYGVPYEHLALDSLYAPGAVTLRTASVQFPKAAGTVIASGTAPLPYGPRPVDPPGHPIQPTPLHLSVRTNGLDLSVLNPLLGANASLGGKLDFAASATGSLQRLILAGSASVRQATVKTQLEMVPLTDGIADVAFNNDSITLSRLHGVLGKGTVDVNGVARLSGSNRSTGGPGALVYRGALRVNNANLSVPKFFSGVLNSDLALHSGPPAARLTGTVAISDASIPFAGILALASGNVGGPPQAAVIPGVPPLRPGHTVAYAGSIYGTDVQYEHPTPKPAPPRSDIVPTTPLQLDVAATAGNNVQTTGLVQVTGAGTLHVRGTADAPSLEGPIDLIRGQVSLFDTTFDLQRGHVAFHPSDGLLPTINVAAAAYRPEAEVTVTVYGRVDELHTDIESDPPMTQDQILANILHIGDINNALSGGGTGPPVNAGAAVGGLVASAATAPIFSALNYGLEQALHIEDVNLAVGANGAPLVELRKAWGKNFYAMFRENLSSPPQQIYGISYNVRNNLEVDFEEEQNPPGQVGVNGLQPIWETILQGTAHFDTNRHRRIRKPAQTGTHVQIPQN